MMGKCGLGEEGSGVSVGEKGREKTEFEKIKVETVMGRAK